MTFFDLLFKMPSVRDRHNSAPLRNERIQFLLYLSSMGRKDIQIQHVASHLLQINRTLGFSESMHSITHEILNRSGHTWKNYVGPERKKKSGKASYQLYIRFARSWLRFNSCLIEPRKTRLSEDRLHDYEKKLKEEIGLSDATIETR